MNECLEKDHNVCLYFYRVGECVNKSIRISMRMLYTLYM